MEPFSIQCDQCQSRLKVRKLAAIGKVLGCPKCGNSIKVVPPPGWSPPADAKVPHSQQTESSKPASNPSKGSESPIESEANAEAGLGTDFEDMDQLLAGLGKESPDTRTPSGTAQPSVTSAPPTGNEGATAGNPVNAPGLPTAAWESDTTKSRQRFTLILSGVIGALVIGILMIGYLVYRLGQPDEQVVQKSPEDELKQVIDDVRSSTDESDDSTANTADDSTDSDMNVTGDANSSTENETGQVVENETNEAGDSNTGDANASTNSSDPLVDGNTGTDDVSSNGDGDNNAVVPSIENPDTDNETEKAPPGFGAPRDRGPDGVGSILDGLDEFGEFIEDSGFESARDEAQAILREDAWLVSDPELPYVEKKGVIRAIDVAAELQAPIVRLSMNEVSIHEVISMAFALSSIPIGIEESAFKNVPDLGTRKWNVDVEDTTVSGLFDSMLGELGLALRIDGHSATIVDAKLLGDMSERSFAAADVIEGFPKMGEDLVQFVTALVAPGSWTDQGGEAIIRTDGDNLVVQHNARVQFEIEQLLERLRKARGLTDDPAVRIQSFNELAAECLDESFEINQIEPIAISRLLRLLEEKANITIACDWESLTVEGWSPTTEVPLIVQDGTINETLRRLAASLDLAFVARGPRQFKFLSKRSYAANPDIEFYDCKQLLASGISVDELAAQIVSIFPPTSATGPQNRFYFDAASQQVMARLPQQQQKALLTFLNSWTETSASSD